jgi:formylglycine-generating enzyme required for sulfatase activity
VNRRAKHAEASARLPWALLLLLAACSEKPAPQPIPKPELTAAAKARLEQYQAPGSWEDLDPSRPGWRLRDPRSGVVFRRIPAGEFDMGSNRFAQEQPQHRVQISRDFLLAETELTIAQWRQHVLEFAGDPEVPLPKQPDSHPMTLSCVDAIGYCERFGYRLPSEAEWEWACTGGLERAAEPWQNEAGMREHAWFHRNADMRAHPVGTRAANAFGLHDMLGNLWEWIGEDWHPLSYAGRTGTVVDPQRPAKGSDRVLRGGSWFSVPPATPRTRLSGNAKERTAFFGCRPARSLD